MDATQRGHFQQLRVSQQRRLRVLEQQQARSGYDTRPEILTEIEDLRASIAEIDEALASAAPPAPRAGAPSLPTNLGPADNLPDDPPAFLVGPPVGHPRAFFGREREVRRIFGMLRRPPLQNTAVIGMRRSGKTSLLHYLRRIAGAPNAHLRPGQRSDWLAQPEQYRWVFVDFQDPRLGRREPLLRGLLAALDLPVPDVCDLETFLDCAAGQIRQPTVILFDEIGVALERYPELDHGFWEGMRALASNQSGGLLAFVLAAHQQPAELARSTGHSSPFFNIFGYVARLGPLEEPDARALIASAPLPFPEADADWIVSQSGCWPILLQVLCRERLLALEEGDCSDAWRAEALCQLEPFSHLLR